MKVNDRQKSKHSRLTSSNEPVKDCTIWKFPLEITDEQNVMMPEGAVILSAQSQSDTLCLWAKVDAKAPLSRRTIRIFGTGHPVPDEPLIFIATAQMLNAWGPLVWHIFELP